MGNDLYYQKVKGIFEEYLLIFDNSKRPILKLDKYDIKRLIEEWETKNE